MQFIKSSAVIIDQSGIFGIFALFYYALEKFIHSRKYAGEAHDSKRAIDSVR